MATRKFLEDVKRLDEEGEHMQIVKMITNILPDNTDVGYLYKIRAQQLLKLEKYKEGASDAKRSLELEPDYETYMLYGRLLYSLGKYTEASEAFTDAKNNRDMKPAGLDPCVQWLAWCEDKIKRLKLKESNSAPSSKVAAEKTSVPAPKPTSSKVKYDWYQTDTYAVISVMVKNTNKGHFQVDFKDDHLNVKTKLSSGDDYTLDLDLCYPVLPDSCSYKIMSTKIEIKLKKKDCIHWPTLERTNNTPKLSSHPEVTTENKALSYPSSASKKKDWDKIEADVIKMEESEKLEGDAALNQLFQKIYKDGSDEVKKAMNKSFSESGGTVLSTNWKEVETSKVDIKAPDGLEFKKWEK